jgi:hypothetical protein
MAIKIKIDTREQQSYRFENSIEKKHKLISEGK